MHRERGECRRQTAGGTADDVREKSRVTAWKRGKVRRMQVGVSLHSIVIITTPGVGAKRAKTGDVRKAEHKTGERDGSGDVS